MIGLLLKKLLTAVLPYTSFWKSDYIISILKQQLFNSFCKTQTKTLPYQCQCDKTELEWYKNHYNSMNYFYLFAYINILVVIFTVFFIQVYHIRNTRNTRNTRKTQDTYSTQEEKAKTPILNKVLKDLDELNKNREILENNQNKKRKFLETIQESLKEQETPNTHQEPLDLEFVTIDL
jgi:hypothetical protein